VASHPQRHVVTRALGSAGRLDIDWQLLDRDPSSTYLLASDGLLAEVGRTEAARLIAGARSAQQAADALVDAAVAAGARDNVTAVLVTPGIAEATASVPDPLDDDTQPRSAVAP
jgi:protein phosphatase